MHRRHFTHQDIGILKAPSRADIVEHGGPMSEVTCSTRLFEGQKGSEARHYRGMVVRILLLPPLPFRHHTCSNPAGSSTGCSDSGPTPEPCISHGGNAMVLLDGRQHRILPFPVPGILTLQLNARAWDSTCDRGGAQVTIVGSKR